VDLIEGGLGFSVSDLHDLGAVLLEDLAIPCWKLVQDAADRPLASLEEILRPGH
jgi:hypothetical protein